MLCITYFYLHEDILHTCQFEKLSSSICISIMICNETTHKDKTIQPHGNFKKKKISFVVPNCLLIHLIYLQSCSEIKQSQKGSDVNKVELLIMWVFIIHLQQPFLYIKKMSDIAHFLDTERESERERERVVGGIW